jgi:hypothetical protein
MVSISPTISIDHNFSKIEPTREKEGNNLNGRMAMGGHGLPKVSLGFAISYHSTIGGQTIPERALWPFQRWFACRAGNLRLSSTPLDTQRHTPMSGTINHIPVNESDQSITVRKENLLFSFQVHFTISSFLSREKRENKQTFIKSKRML